MTNRLRREFRNAMIMLVVALSVVVGIAILFDQTQALGVTP